MVSHILCKHKVITLSSPNSSASVSARHSLTLISFPDWSCILALYIPARHPVAQSLAGDAMFLGCTIHTTTTLDCHQCSPQAVICILTIWSHPGWPVGEHCKSKYINCSQYLLISRSLNSNDHKILNTSCLGSI